MKRKQGTIHSGSGIESSLLKKILCLYFCDFPRVRIFCDEASAMLPCSPYERDRTEFLQRRFYSMIDVWAMS
jgi:hypothetical protein